MLNCNNVLASGNQRRFVATVNDQQRVVTAKDNNNPNNSKRKKVLKPFKKPIPDQGVDLATRKPPQDDAVDSSNAAEEPGGDGPPKQAQERLFLGWLFGR